ncbi:hypothetical protein D3C81_1680430 [compost metagenome]
MALADWKARSWARPEGPAPMMAMRVVMVFSQTVNFVVIGKQNFPMGMTVLQQRRDETLPVEIRQLG